MAIANKLFGIFCLTVMFNVIFAQSNNMLCLSDNPISASDSIGKYDINCIVLGIIELDSLVGITCWYTVPHWRNFLGLRLMKKKIQYSTGAFYTRRCNVPLEHSVPIEKIKSLIRDRDYFLIENSCGVIMDYIYPRCNEEGKRRLEESLSNSNSVYDVAYMPPLDSSWKDVIKSKSVKGKEYIDEAFFYDAYGGRNEYLLVIMNRRWHDLLVITETEPPQMFDDTDLYVKYLIPLKPINKKKRASN